MSLTSSETKSLSLLQAVDRCKSNLALPAGAQQAMLAGDWETPDPVALRRWLNSDPELTRRLLRWSNSPIFNLARPFCDLTELLAVLGERHVTHLAILASIRPLFLPNLRIDCYAREQLWRHSIAVGAVAALVARVCQTTPPQDAFVAGTLHDLGLLAAEKADPQSFTTLIAELDALTDTAATERHRYGWDHQMLGAELLGRWGFPQAYCDVARFHHQVHLTSRAEDEALVCCVVVADYLCSRCGWTELGLHNLAQPPDSVFTILGIDQSCLAILWQQLYATLEQTRDFI